MAYEKNVEWLEDHGFKKWSVVSGVVIYVRGGLTVKLIPTEATVCVQMVGVEQIGDSPFDAICRAQSRARLMRDRWAEIDATIREIRMNEESGAAEDSGYFTS